MNLIFLDTECTGTETEDRLLQLAYKCGDIIVSELFKPPVPIKIGAMAVHHITEEMVADKPVFETSEVCGDLKTLLADTDSVLVAHNAKFDIEMLAKEWIITRNFICTMKVARHLDTNGTIDSYALQYLRYLLKLDVQAPAHDALGDVLVLEKLYERLAAKLSVEEMVKISSQPSLIRRLTFGKHRGKTITEVLAIDIDWLEWLLGEKKKEAQPDEDWLFTLNHYLNGNTS